MKKPWHKISDFFEHGDLVPFAVVVSVWHFIGALMAHGESWPIAVATGVLVDMLHFRTVRHAVRHRAKRNAAIAVLTTAMSFAFHWLFYAYSDGGYSLHWINFLLAAPLPIGIPILAWQVEHAQRKQSHKARNARTKLVIRIARRLQATAKEAQAAASQAQADNNKLQAECKRLQEVANVAQARINEQQVIIKAWQHLNDEAQALARYNAKQITAEQAADIIGVRDVRTVQSRAQKLNGKA